MLEKSELSIHKRTIERNWQDRVNTTYIENTTHHVLDTQRNTNDVNMTRSLLQTTAKIITDITTRNSERKDIY
jgi:hypothetical protein